MINLEHRNARIAISPFCNLNCIYCDSSKGRQGNKPGAMEDFRRKDLKNGCIDTKTYLKIIKALYTSGFRGIALTGGEPFLNPDWGVISDYAKNIGMQRVGVTTNGVLLKEYIKRNNGLPKGFTLLTISLDTIDNKKFAQITGHDKLRQVIEGLKLVKKTRPEVTIRANKVMLKSEMSSLINYIKFCEKSKTIDEINLLNLILKEDKNKEFFQKEFISAQEGLEFLSKQKDFQTHTDKKYEFNINLQSGIKLIIKDTDITLRNQMCNNCSIYCQEGFFTIRVATDGTINLCPDYEAKLPYIDSISAIKKGNLEKEIKNLVRILEDTKKVNTLKKFLKEKSISF